MKKDDILTVEITDLTNEGLGVGKSEGFPLFIKDTVPGDIAKVKVIKLKKSYGYGRLMEIVQPSADRIEPFCDIHRACGGCQLQTMSYEGQLRFKYNKVLNNLVRIGGFDETEISSISEGIVGMEDPTAYRNKAQFPIGYDRKGNIVSGFFAARSHDIVPVSECGIGIPENTQILSAVKTWMEQFDLKAYDEAIGDGLVRHVLIKKGFATGEILTCIVISKDADVLLDTPAHSALIDALVKVPGMTSVSLNINKERTNRILGDKCVTLWGRDFIKDKINGIKFNISPLSFYQVNPVQTKALYETALEYAGLNGTETVWDLYCGIGTISLFMAQEAKNVYGIEIVPQAVEDAKKNAFINGMSNVKFMCGKAEDILSRCFDRGASENTGTNRFKQDPGLQDNVSGDDEEEWISAAQNADVIVTDPPRKGCDEVCLNTMIAMAPPRIVYVSCDSATLARDLKILCNNGYKLTRWKAVDMFPQTVHVETVALLSKLSEAKHHIEVKVDMDELDLTSAEAKATYKEIQDWVQEKYGFHVTNLNIAQVKQKHGIIERENYNKPKSPDSKQPGCPEEKVKVIEDALRHFQMI